MSQVSVILGTGSNERPRMIRLSIYSPSRLAAYRECPLKYRFIYVDRIRKHDPIEAFMGSRVHETLEEVVGARTRTGKDLGFEEASTIFHWKWDEKYSEDVVIKREDLTSEAYQAKGLEYIRKFFEIESRRRPAEVVGLEKRVEFVLGEHLMKGFIDRLERSGNNFSIIDYKATYYPFSQDRADADWQFGIYELAVRDEVREAEKVSLNWYFLGPGLVVSSSRSAQQRQDLRRSITALIAEIEKADDFPPIASHYCYRCNYALECAEEKTTKIPWVCLS